MIRVPASITISCLRNAERPSTKQNVARTRMLTTTIFDTICKQAFSKKRDRAKTAENGRRYASTWVCFVECAMTGTQFPGSVSF